MIKFSLVCTDGHAFDSWFASGAAYEQQSARALVQCPVCASHLVTKSIMAPAIAIRSGHMTRTEVTPPLPSPSPEPAAPVLLDPQHREIRELMGAMRSQILADTVDVGKNFPDEARKMHAGDIPTRPIRGEASVEDVHSLIEDGVKIMPVPAAPEDLN